MDRPSGICQHRRSDGYPPDHRSAAAVHIGGRNIASCNYGSIWGLVECGQTSSMIVTRIFCGSRGERNQRQTVVIAGGGTAGHLFPGIAIAQALVDRGVVPSEAEIHLVGSRHGVESQMGPDLGFQLTLLSGRGFRRNFTLVNVVSLLGLLLAFVRSLSLVLRLSPRVVVATGGYACVPCGLAAVVLGVPLVITEQNAVPGIANKILGRFARVAAVAFDGTKLPRAVTTGNPVRLEIREMLREGAREMARDRMGIGSRDLVVIFGGSLGARRINQTTEKVVENWDGPPVVVHHIVGRREWRSGGKAPSQPGPALEYRRVAYEDEMALVLAASDLVVCRSGATTVSELAVLGIPAILIPLPTAPGSHQHANAERVVMAGGAVLIDDPEVDGKRLSKEIRLLLEDRHALAEMGARAQKLGRPEAANRVADLVKNVGDDSGHD